MFKLAKLLIGVVALAAFVWFGANVSLGSRTLFEHLQAIGKTRETKDLLDGTREKAKPLVDSVRRKLVQEAVGAAALAPDAGATSPSDDIPAQDRERLKKLLAGEAGERTSRASRTPH